jgi:signal transduction histidine kinase
MLVHDKAYGVMVVQSYDPTILYTKTELDLLAFIASHVAVAIARMQADHAIRKAKESLEKQNAALNQALTQLQEAQSELVRQEKLASLGQMVAGVAHEINTPLGICVTATSHLVQELKLTKEELAAGEMTEDTLNSFFDVVDQSLRIMTTNTQRAAALVRSFKQVAVDQSSDNIRNFNLCKYVGEILLSLQPKLKGRPVKVQVDCPADLEVNSFPGAVSQILTNMVVNSLVHGFERDQPGNITIRARLEDDDMVAFEYGDDGAGMDADTLAKLFDPFFTTKRGSGGSGLGAHILYNLVTGSLGGSLRVESSRARGCSTYVRFPRKTRKDGDGHRLKRARLIRRRSLRPGSSSRGSWRTRRIPRAPRARSGGFPAGRGRCGRSPAPCTRPRAGGRRAGAQDRVLVRAGVELGLEFHIHVDDPVTLVEDADRLDVEGTAVTVLGLEGAGQFNVGSVVMAGAYHRWPGSSATSTSAVVRTTQPGPICPPVTRPARPPPSCAGADHPATASRPASGFRGRRAVPSRPARRQSGSAPRSGCRSLARRRRRRRHAAPAGRPAPRAGRRGREFSGAGRSWRTMISQLDESN